MIGVTFRFESFSLLTFHFPFLEWVTNLCAFSDGPRVVLGSLDRKLRVWNVTAVELNQGFEGLGVR
jgi:WD40 repeat protein